MERGQKLHESPSTWEETSEVPQTLQRVDLNGVSCNFAAIPRSTRIGDTRLPCARGSGQEMLVEEIESKLGFQRCVGFKEEGRARMIFQAGGKDLTQEKFIPCLGDKYVSCLV